MTSPTVVYSGVSSTHDVGGVLFKDTKFWLSRTVPSRSWIIQQIQVSLSRNDFIALLLIVILTAP